MRNVLFVENQADCGGAVWCVDSSLDMVSVHFVDNYSYLECGGGIFCERSSVNLTDCVFAGNTGGGMLFEAIECETGGCTLTRCVFDGNVSEESGGGLRVDLIGAPGLIVVEDCIFRGNTAGTLGGGMGVYSGPGASSWVTATGCRFYGNSAHSGGGCGLNGVVATCSGCTFWTNTAFEGGGLFVDWGSADEITGCTFVENSAQWGGGLWGWVQSLSNTLIAFNTGEHSFYGLGDGVSCTDMHGNSGGDWVGMGSWLGADGNICEDPLLCGDENPQEPCTLQELSPCAAENNAECGQIGAWGVGCESLTSVRATSWGAVKAMFR
jgi:hypothetical protein